MPQLVLSPSNITSSTTTPVHWSRSRALWVVVAGLVIGCFLFLGSSSTYTDAPLDILTTKPDDPSNVSPPTDTSSQDTRPASQQATIDPLPKPSPSSHPPRPSNNTSVVTGASSYTCLDIRNCLESTFPDFPSQIARHPDLAFTSDFKSHPDWLATIGQQCDQWTGKPVPNLLGGKCQLPRYHPNYPETLDVLHNLNFIIIGDSTARRTVQVVGALAAAKPDAPDWDLTGYHLFPDTGGHDGWRKTLRRGDSRTDVNLIWAPHESEMEAAIHGKVESAITAFPDAEFKVIVLYVAAWDFGHHTVKTADQARVWADKMVRDARDLKRIAGPNSVVLLRDPPTIARNYTASGVVFTPEVTSKVIDQARVELKKVINDSDINDPVLLPGMSWQRGPYYQRAACAISDKRGVHLMLDTARLAQTSELLYAIHMMKGSKCV